MRLVRLLSWSIWTIVILVVVDVLVLRVIGADRLTGPLVIVNLIAFILALVLDAERIRRRPFEFSAFVPMTPAAVMDQADSWFDGRGWDLQDSADDRVVVQRDPETPRATVALLFLAGIVPGLIYLAVTRNARPVSLTVAPVVQEGGARVDLSGTGLSSEALAFFRSLHTDGDRRRR